MGGSDRRYRCPLGVASGRNNRQRWALLLLSAVCVRRAGLPRRGENRFLRPTQKNPWCSSNGPRAGPPALRPRGIGLGFGCAVPGAGVGRGGPVARSDAARACLFILPRVSPATRRRGLSMPALGGGAHPCAPLGLVAVAPRGPVSGRSRRAAGAGSAGSGVAGSWGCAVAALSSVVLRVRSAAVRRVAVARAARRRRAAGGWSCPFCGSSRCRPVVSACGAVFASPSCPGGADDWAGW